MNWIRRTTAPMRRRWMAVLLALVTVSGATLVAGAPADARPAHVMDSKRFTITNLSGYRVQLNAASGSWEGKPDENTWVLPGQQQSFELKSVPLGSSHGIVRYYKYSDDGLLQGDFWVDLYLDWKKSATSSCRSFHGTCTAGGSNIVLRDDANTVVTLGGDQAQAQADTLDRLCRDLADVSCRFDVKTETKAMIPSHLVGSPYANRTLDRMTKQIRISETVDRTQSVEFSTTVEASVLKLVQASVTAKYGQVWTNSRTFEESGVAVIRPGYKVWSEITEPVLRFTGDFNLQVGNTTFRLVNVYFDQADPKPSADRHPIVETFTAPLQSTDSNLPPVGAMPSVIVSHRDA